VEMVLRPEVGNLRGHVAAKWRRIEARQRADRRRAGFESRPQSVSSGPDRCDGSDTGNDDPTKTLHFAPSAARLIPARVREAIPWMNTRPLPRFAARRPKRGPPRTCPL